MADDTASKPLDQGGGPAPGLTASYTGKYPKKGAEDTSRSMAFSPYSNSAFAPGALFSAFNPPINSPYGNG